MLRSSAQNPRGWRARVEGEGQRVGG